MSMIVRAALAAIVSLAFVSNATAQSAKHPAKAKAFTAEEKLYFDRASDMTGGPAGGGAGDGGGSGS